MSKSKVVGNDRNTLLRLNFLRDTTFNTHVESGSSVEYGKGCLLGLVSGLMVCNMDFNHAWALVKENLPKGYRVECIPPSWRNL